jgi:hypothetical protein
MPLRTNSLLTAPIGQGFVPKADRGSSSPHHELELRAHSDGNPLRIFYAFDPRRTAILFLGCDKTGVFEGSLIDILVAPVRRTIDRFPKESATYG